MNRKKREQLILDAAIRVFARQGYGHTSVSEIIEEAQVARGTFYLYFQSKKDVFEKLLNRFMMEVSQNVIKITALELKTQGDLYQHFRAMAGDLITTLTKNRLLTKIILLDSNGLDASFDTKLTLFYDQLAEIIRHNLDIQIKAGIFRPSQTDMVARCIMGSVREIICTWITRDQFELEATLQTLIDYLLNGLVSTIPLAVKQPMPEEHKSLSRQGINLH